MPRGCQCIAWFNRLRHRVDPRASLPRPSFSFRFVAVPQLFQNHRGERFISTLSRRWRAARRDLVWDAQGCMGPDYSKVHIESALPGRLPRTSPWHLSRKAHPHDTMRFIYGCCFCTPPECAAELPECTPCILELARRGTGSFCMRRRWQEVIHDHIACLIWSTPHKVGRTWPGRARDLH